MGLSLTSTEEGDHSGTWGAVCILLWPYSIYLFINISSVSSLFNYVAFSDRWQAACRFKRKTDLVDMSWLYDITAWRRGNGLVVWFSVWVREVPVSITGFPLFCKHNTCMYSNKISAVPNHIIPAAPSWWNSMHSHSKPSVFCFV